tara:strand:+ start:14972 stop:15856 length:885 start_codon:yes stop_codon:yes gene_type:complete
MEKKTHQSHIPVMPEEVISLFNINPAGKYVDGTCGLGGHSKLIQNKLSREGALIALDIDQKAIQNCKNSLSEKNSKLYIKKGSYSDLPMILKHLNIDKVDGILLDLGLSSMQLDSNNRGFSFKKNACLDMRFDQDNKIDAASIINKSSKSELADIIYYFGEEKRSRPIAAKIYNTRPMLNTQDLVSAIKKSTPPKNRNKTLARVFQAFRISVNRELEKLSDFLTKYIQCLETGGKIIIISFHSLEDRLVKRNFRNYSDNGLIKILTKKPMIATDLERISNSRSKSAKLRCAEKI